MEKKAIINAWLTIIKSVSDDIKDDFIDEEKLTDFDFTTGALSKFISRTILTLYILNKYCSVDIAKLNNFEKLYNYITTNNKNSSLDILIIHGLELEHLYENRIKFESYYRNILRYVLCDVMLSSPQAQLDTMISIVHVLHAFRFDNSFDEFISKLIGVKLSSKKLNILTFGAKCPDLLHDINKSPIVHNLTSLMYDIGRWRENQLLCLFNKIGNNCRAELADLIELDDDLEYDYIYLNSNSTIQYKEYDINYYLRLSNLTPEDRLNLQEKVVTELSIDFGINETSLSAKIGKSNLYFFHIFYALKKLKVNNGKLIIAVKESDITANDFVAMDMLSGYIDSVYYVNTTLGNKVVFVLSYSDKDKFSDGKNIYYYNFKLDKNSELIKFLNKKIPLECQCVLHWVNAGSQLGELKSFDQFYIKSKSNDKVVLYKFNHLELIDDNNEETIGKYFKVFRFRLSQITRNVLPDIRSSYGLIRSSSIANNKLTPSSLYYYPSLHEFTIDQPGNDEVRVNDIILNRKCCITSYSQVLISENHLIDEYGNKLTLIADENVYILRLKDEMRAEFKAKDFAVKDISYILKSLIFKQIFDEQSESEKSKIQNLSTARVVELVIPKYDRTLLRKAIKSNETFLQIMEKLEKSL